MIVRIYVLPFLPIFWEKDRKFIVLLCKWLFKRYLKLLLFFLSNNWKKMTSKSAGFGLWKRIDSETIDCWIEMKIWKEKQKNMTLYYNEDNEVMTLLDILRIPKPSASTWQWNIVTFKLLLMLPLKPILLPVIWAVEVGDT